MRRAAERRVLYATARSHNTWDAALVIFVTVLVGLYTRMFIFTLKLQCVQMAAEHSTLRMNLEKVKRAPEHDGLSTTQEGLCVVRHDRAATEVARDRREGEVVEGLCASAIVKWSCCPGLAQEAVEDSASPHEHAEDHQKANRHVAASRNHIAEGLDGVTRMVMIITSAPVVVAVVTLGGSLCNRPSVHDAHIVAAHGLLFLLAQCGGHALGHARHELEQHLRLRSQ